MRKCGEASGLYSCQVLRIWMTGGKFQLWWLGYDPLLLLFQSFSPWRAESHDLGFYVVWWSVSRFSSHCSMWIYRTTDDSRLDLKWIICHSEESLRKPHLLRSNQPITWSHCIAFHASCWTITGFRSTIKVKHSWKWLVINWGTKKGKITFLLF